MSTLLNTIAQVEALSAKRQYDDAWDALDAFQATLPKGLCIGKLVYFPVADGNAHYLVSAISPRTVSLQHINLVDGYHAYGIVNNGKASRKIVDETIQRIEALDAIFGN